MNLIDKAAARFEKIVSNFERISAMGKMLSNYIAHNREIMGRFLLKATELSFNTWSIQQMFAESCPCVGLAF